MTPISSVTIIITTTTIVVILIILIVNEDYKRSVTRFTKWMYGE